MRIDLKVVSGSSRSYLKKTKLGITAYVTAPAVDGKANKALVELLAEEFKVRKSQISIIKGLKSRHKTININES